MDTRASASYSLLPLLLVLGISLVPLCLSSSEAVTVSIKSVNRIGRTDDTFVCATMDWWPPTKCNYGMCPWGNSSMLSLDLKNPLLFNAIKAFEHLRIRLGGTLQDKVFYSVGTNHPKCGRTFQLDNNALFGFTDGCLSMRRWNKLNKLFNSTGVILTFGLNALNGRKKENGSSLYLGSWDGNNTLDFMNYTVSQGFKVESWELGNELSGSGIGARVDAKQYGEDLITLKTIINQVYANSSLPMPKILAPGGFFDAKWFAQMIQTAGRDALDTVTHHIYNLGPGADPNLPLHIVDGFNLDNTAGTYKELQITLRDYAPWASAWIGEAGGAYNSGGRVASHTFVNSFWYLDQLGMTSTFGHQVFCRQTLIGGNYGLLNPTTFIPNPDYYSALLWHRLMGPNVLATTHTANSTDLRAYSHCSKGQPGVTLLLINLSNTTTFNITVKDDFNFYPLESALLDVGQGQNKRQEYRLTPKDGNILSETMLLNDQPLYIASSGDIPNLSPSDVSSSSPISIDPRSIVFISMKDFSAPACA